MVVIQRGFPLIQRAPGVCPSISVAPGCAPGGSVLNHVGGPRAPTAPPLLRLPAWLTPTPA